MIEESKKNDLSKLLTGLGILNIGKATAKALARHFKTMDALENAETEELTQVTDIGEVSAAYIRQFFQDEKNRKILKRLKENGVNMELTEIAADQRFFGKTFVLTGTLLTMGRKEAAEKIEKFG